MSKVVEGEDDESIFTKDKRSVMVDLHYTDFSYSKSYKSYNKSYSFFGAFGWG